MVEKSLNWTILLGEVKASPSLIDLTITKARAMKFWKDLKEAIRNSDDVEVNINLSWAHVAFILSLIWLIVLLWK